MTTAVDQLIEKMSLEDVCKYSNELAEAKEMEKEQSLKMPTYNLNELADEYYKQFDNLPVVRYNAYVAGFKKAMELLTFKQQEQ